MPWEPPPRDELKKLIREEILEIYAIAARIKELMKEAAKHLKDISKKPPDEE